MAISDHNLVWVDMEMTGLIPEVDRVIEIATIVTDSHLNVLAEGPVIAIKQPDAALEALRFDDGKLYALPWVPGPVMMFYNRNLLEQAGFDPDQPPTTWDELLAASRTIKEKTGKTGFAFPAALQIWFPVNYYLWSNGAEFISADGNGGYEIGVSQDQLAEAMGYFKTYIDEGLAPTSILSIDQPHDPALMQALLDGDQAFAVMPTNTYRQLLGAFEEANPGAPVPFQSTIMMAGDQPPLTHLGGRTLVVNANTDAPEAAWKLVQFLTSAPLFENYYTNQFPAQKSLLSQIDYREEETGFATQLADHTRTWGAYAESGVGVGPLWNVTSRAFGTALSGQSSLDEAAADLLSEIDRMLDQ